MILRHQLFVIFITCSLALNLNTTPLHASQDNTSNLNKSDYLPIYLLIAYQYKKDNDDKIIMSLVQIQNSSSYKKLAYVHFFLEGRELRYWADYLEKKSNELRQYLIILLENQTPRYLENITFSIISSWSFADWYKLYESIIQKSDPDRDVFQQITLSPPYLFSLKINDIFVKQKMIGNKFDVENSVADIPDEGIEWIINNLEVVKSTINDAETIFNLSKQINNSTNSLNFNTVSPARDSGDKQEDKINHEQIKVLLSQLSSETEHFKESQKVLSAIIASNKLNISNLSKSFSDEFLEKVPGRVAEAVLKTEKIKNLTENLEDIKNVDRRLVGWPPFIFLLVLLIISFTFSMLYLSYIYRSINKKNKFPIVTLNDSEYEVLKPVNQKSQLSKVTGDHDADKAALSDQIRDVKITALQMQKNYVRIVEFLKNLATGLNGNMDSMKESGHLSIRALLLEIRSMIDRHASNQRQSSQSDQLAGPLIEEKLVENLTSYLDRLNENFSSQGEELMQLMHDISHGLTSYQNLLDRFESLDESVSDLGRGMKSHQTEMIHVIQDIHRPSDTLMGSIQSLHSDIDSLRQLLPDPQSSEARLIAINDDKDFLLQLSTLLTQQKKAIEDLRTDINKNMEEYLYIGGPQPKKPVIDTYQKVEEIIELLKRNNPPAEPGESNE